MLGFHRRTARFRFVTVAVCLLLPAATFGATLTGCGTDLTNPREVYLEFRSKYDREDYDGMLEYLYSGSRQQLARATDGDYAADGLRRYLPPKGDIERLVDDVLSENPDAADGLESDQRRQLFYRILAARHAVRRKSRSDLSDREAELRNLDLRYTLALNVPRDELGPRMNPQGDSIEFNLEPAGQLTFPIQRDSQNRARLVWPRETR